ncbi:DUF3558 domain-containing protein [Rhodococcus spelaei]|uniref:DUF3558 domain-containing protein n=1 Tax=Rhodococcus spelaei TaxID=2546320 RepID=UPI0025B70A3E|nr:DUF3558 domain-containing protein [Rhodococcus spelaei]
MRKAVGVVGVVGAALLVAGCGSGSVDGKADAVGAAAGEPVFSPCDDIPGDALAAIGLDPTTATRDIAGVKQPGWNICKWRGASPALSVLATSHTLDDVRDNRKNTEFSPVDISGRTAFSYRENTDQARRNCDVAIGASGGAVLIAVSYLGTDPVVKDPCVVAVERTRALAAYIPE